tara:strand:+ start:733 stop:1503 length:771 start_codon:yes stop_codon:yes gene_type:complete
MIETEDDNGIRLIRLKGDTASTSFSRKSMKIITEAIDSALTDDSVRGFVLTGEGRFFSAGADINDFQNSLDKGEIVTLIHDLTGLLHPLLMRMRRSSKISVAAINGAAAGGGLGLALACDARIAGNNAKLAASYAGIGLSPDGGTTWVLPRLVGEQIAKRFFFNNSIWNSEQALEFGAVDEIAEDPIAAALDLARKWSRWSDHTRESTKHLLDSSHDNDFEEHLHHERILIKAAGCTAEFKEGVSAFLEKREPDFS